MPISDYESYPPGHFKRVYDFIIKPACLKAEFIPIRADDVLNTNYIALDVVRHIIDSDMAICDLSSRNPNVLYELGIRQAFNLPVTLMKDMITQRIFDIQGFRDIEYDESLRIDNVEITVNVLAETIRNTYQTKGQEINSLVSLLGIHPAKITNRVEISTETELILNSLINLSRRLERIENPSPKVNVFPNAFVIDETNGTWRDLDTADSSQLQIGDIIEHPKFGKGFITIKEGTPNNPIVEVSFQQGGSKKLMLNFVRIRKFEKAE